MMEIYKNCYPSTLSKIKSLVELDYTFKTLPSEEFKNLTRLFYMECDTDTLFEIQTDFNVNACLVSLLRAETSPECEIAGWSLQHSIHDYITKHFKHIFRQLFESAREEYMQMLNESLYEDLKPGYCANL